MANILKFGLVGFWAKITKKAPQRNIKGAIKR